MSGRRLPVSHVVPNCLAGEAERRPAGTVCGLGLSGGEVWLIDLSTPGANHAGHVWGRR